MTARASSGRRNDLPYVLATGVLLAQVGLGAILFAVFQEFVPAHLGAGDAWPGYLLALYGGARFVAETPTGAISDRVERKLGLLIGYVLMVPAIILMGLVHDRYAYLAFAAQLGLATAFLWPSTYAISADLYPSERRGTVIGLLNLAQLLGFGIGALAGALLVERNTTVLFTLASAAVVGAFLTTLVWLPQYRSGGLFRRVHHPHRRPSLRSVLSFRLASFSVFILAVSTSLSMVVPAIRPFGEHDLGVSFERLTIALIPAVVIGAALFVPAGQITDRFGRIIPLLAGQALIVIGLLGVAGVRDLVPAAGFAVVVFCGNVLTVPAWNAAIMDLAPESHRGTIIGLSVALSGLGLALGPALGGFVVSEFGAPEAFRMGALLCTLAALGIALHGLRYRSRPPIWVG